MEKPPVGGFSFEGAGTQSLRSDERCGSSPVCHIDRVTCLPPVRMLGPAYGDRVFDTLLHVKTLTVYDPLRDHPKFISLLQQMGLE